MKLSQALQLIPYLNGHMELSGSCLRPCFAQRNQPHVVEHQFRDNGSDVQEIIVPKTVLFQ